MPLEDDEAESRAQLHLPLNLVIHQFFLLMAASSQSQHRCVFVGNIPYDATEEQLIQICEEVGPVVSFRLVIDRETGKPKGYGFCEYKDEETALSARRNLQGYEINGRQLRVDFAENDKNADKNREQGRGGPGIVPNIDPQKQFGGPAISGDPNLYQPVGDSVAMAAATIMAGALGAAQAAGISKQIGLPTQSPLGIDPLTRHLAKMSRSQLTEIMSEVKAMATQNKEQARQLLLAIPNLPKALFEAQIMLGIVSAQMLQMPNIRQAAVQPVQPLAHTGPTLPGLPPLPQNKLHFGLLPSSKESQVSTGVPNQYAALTQYPTQSKIQLSQLMQNQFPHQGQQLTHSGVSSLPSVFPQSLGVPSVRPHIHPSISSSSNQQVQPPMLQHVGQNHPSALIRPQFSADGFQTRSPASSAMPENMDLKGHDLSSLGKTRMVNDSMDQANTASKLAKLNDGRVTSSLHAVNMDTHISGASQTFDLSRRHYSTIEETSKSEKQATSQMQLPQDVDSALVEQVLNLTPEQLSSLPPDQQQQVIQLQKMLRQAM